MKFRFSASVFILLVVLSACASAENTSTESLPGDTGTAVTPTQASGEHLTTSSPSSETLTSGTLVLLPTSTPTRDTSGIDWREIPIIPDVSERVFQIYQDGQEQGRDPHSFSVIGDCQSIPFVFLGPFGRGEQEPDPAESYLWDALDFFDASIDRWSVTSRGGFTAASILSAIQADTQYCKPGETPLTCEYRLNNPAYVFITLETWLDPATIDRYEDYLRLILDYVIERGSVPILLTKADNAEVDEGRHVINPAIVRVALQYDVPVVNFWRAAQYLDNIGIDPDRDGFHLSGEGYDLKNALALRALYTIWQAVEQRGTAGSTGPSDSAATSTPAPGNSSPVGPLVTVPACTGGCIFFGTIESQDGVSSAGGVYAYNSASQALVQVLGSGFDLQDVSEDGLRLLVNQENFLYEVDLTDSSSNLLSSTFFWMGKQGAYWNSDDSLPVFIDQTHPFLTPAGAAITLYPSSRDDEIWFKSGTCASKDFCEPAGVYRLDQDQSLTPMDTYARPVFSPDGVLMAFLNPAAATRDNYYHIWYLLMEEPDRSALTRRIFYFPDEPGFLAFPEVGDYAFSPQNDKLYILYDVYSENLERSLRLQTYLVDLTTGILYDYEEKAGFSGSLKPHIAWAPDGLKVFLFLTETPSEDEFTLNIYQSDLMTGEKLTLFDNAILAKSEYFYLTNLVWR